ncbi:MAG: hypothetical protein ACLPHI_04160 [Terriglobales bacterium]|jgi:hypothetical protein
MMTPAISPYPMRSTVSQQDGALRISIPAARNTIAMLLISFWLCVWTVGGIATARQLLGKGESNPSFLTPKVGHFRTPYKAGNGSQTPSRLDSSKGFWMCGWALGEVLAAFWLCRMLGGRDIFQTTNGTAEIRREIFGLGLSTKQYSLQAIHNLRYQPDTSSGKTERPSGIAFDYGSRTVFFGDGADEAEANQLIGMIKLRQEERCKLAQSQAVESASSHFWQRN